MVNYNYWSDHVKKFKEEFGVKLGIEYCELNISEYTQKYPQVIFSVIRMPIYYLNFIDFHSNMILSNSNIFKSIGNAKVEIIHKGNFDTEYLPLKFYNLRSNNTNFSDTIPVDHRRKKFAGLLRDIITFFAIYHEIGHIRQESYSPTQEIGYTEKKCPTIFEKQAAEIDADVFAINFLWETVFNNYHKFLPNGTLNNVNELIELSLYSTFLFFYLSNNDDELNNPQKEHPHPIIRFSIISNFLETIVLSNELCGNSDFNKILQSVKQEFDYTLTYHFNVVENHKYYSRFDDSEIPEIRSRLQEYSSKNPALNFNRPYTLN
jgi:hypothetical protein